MVGDDCTQVVFAVYELDPRLDVVFLVDAEHQTGLVKAHLIVSRNLYLYLKLSSVGGIIERSIVYGKSIVRDTPVVTVRGDRHVKCFSVYFPLLRFVEPLHLLEGLCLQA